MDAKGVSTACDSSSFDHTEPKVPTINVLFYAAPNHDPLNYYGRAPRLVGCLVPESDPILTKIAKWSTGGLTLTVKVTGIITAVSPGHGTPGVIINEVRPDSGSVWLSNCKFE